MFEYMNVKQVEVMWLQDANDSRCRSIVIAASKQSRMRTGGKKSRAPSSPGWTRCTRDSQFFIILVVLKF